MKDINRSDWESVQNSEQLWWINLKEQVALDVRKGLLVPRAHDIYRDISFFSPNIINMRLLQIGPGGSGEINFMPGERYAIDPLAPFFKKNFRDLIDPKVNFIEGVGEDLPYDDGFFDVALFLNVIDHCFDPEKTLNEIHRVLKIGGLLILEVNIYNVFTSKMHELLYFIDREHPYAFTKKMIRSQLGRKYDILKETFSSLSFTDMLNLKRLLFMFLKYFRLAPVRYTVIARKK